MLDRTGRVDLIIEWGQSRTGDGILCPVDHDGIFLRTGNAETVVNLGGQVRGGYNGPTDFNRPNLCRAEMCWFDRPRRSKR
jgi:hypothetical protein